MCHYLWCWVACKIKMLIHNLTVITDWLKQRGSIHILEQEKKDEYLVDKILIWLSWLNNEALDFWSLHFHT